MAVDICDTQGAEYEIDALRAAAESHRLEGRLLARAAIHALEEKELLD